RSSPPSDKSRKKEAPGRPGASSFQRITPLSLRRCTHRCSALRRRRSSASTPSAEASATLSPSSVHASGRTGSSVAACWQSTRGGSGGVVGPEDGGAHAGRHSRRRAGRSRLVSVDIADGLDGGGGGGPGLASCSCGLLPGFVGHRLAGDRVGVLPLPGALLGGLALL